MARKISRRRPPRDVGTPGWVVAVRCTPQSGRLRFRGVHLRRSLRSPVGGRPLGKQRLTTRCCRGCVPPRMWGVSTAAEARCRRRSTPPLRVEDTTMCSHYSDDYSIGSSQPIAQANSECLWAQTGPPICANKSPEICPRPTGCRPPSKRGWSTPSRTPKKAGSKPARSTPHYRCNIDPFQEGIPPADSISQWAPFDDSPMGHHWRPPVPVRLSLRPSWILCRPARPPDRNPPVAYLRNQRGLPSRRRR